MFKNNFKKIRSISLFLVILALVMGNFFHAFLMDASPTQLADNNYGACHSQQAENDSKTPTAPNSILPCCADNQSEQAVVIAVLSHPQVTIYPLALLTISPLSNIRSSIKLSSAPNSPNQIALNKIVLRI